MSGYDLINAEAFIDRCSDYMRATDQAPLSRDDQHEINEHLWNADVDAFDYARYMAHGEPISPGPCARRDYPADIHLPCVVRPLMAFMDLSEQGRIGEGVPI